MIKTTSIEFENTIIDVKSFAKLNEKEINKSVNLKHIDSIQNTKNNWMELLSFNSNEITWIKNWLRYRIATKLMLYTNPYFDCDNTDHVKNICKKMLLHSKDISEEDIIFEKYNRYIYFQDKESRESIVLETDTMNSMATTFDEFMRRWLQKHYGKEWWNSTYVKVYNLSKYDFSNTGVIFRDIFFLNNIDEWIDKMKSNNEAEELRCIEQFNRFAKLTHTLGNFTLVPKGYNTGRVKRTKDYWDLTLLDLQEMKITNKYQDINYQWYMKHIDLFKMDCWFNDIKIPFDVRRIKRLFENHSFTQVLPSAENIENCIKEINVNIIERSNKILLGRCVDHNEKI